MPRILVTGAGGFIGSHLVPRLRALQHEVFAVNRLSGDIAAASTWRVLPDAEVVIHLAGRTFVPESWADPVGFLSTNLNSAVCALDYCMEHNARLVFMSSYLYGVPDALPIAESATLHANNPYALSKKLGEEACRFYSDYFAVSVTVLRPFNIYGPGQDIRFLIPSIVEQIHDGNPVQVQDLEPKRDYVYIDDVIEAFVAAIDHPRRFDVFNIASGTSHSVKEVIDLIQKSSNKNLPVKVVGTRRPQEVMDTRADIARAREILGWFPHWNLDEGIAKILREKKNRS